MFIYHLTSVDNLESIFNCGLLKARNNLEKNEFVNIANANILQKRKKIKFGDNDLLDFVPFHYWENEIFLNAFFKNKNKKSAVYLKFDLDNTSTHCIFTNKHPLNTNCFFSNNLSILNSSEKEIFKFMNKKVFNHKYLQKDLKDLLNAEILIYKEYSLKNLKSIHIFTKDKEIKKTIETFLGKYNLIDKIEFIIC